MQHELKVEHPDRPDKLRSFKDRREAAKFGVAYYLSDNGYATRQVAARVASDYQSNGFAAHGGFVFTEQLGLI